MKNDELKKILSELEAKDGTLTPANVVRAASAKDHPLHGEFEWDNRKAGYKYRLQQAATMIRAVRVNWEVETTTIKAQAYVRNPSLPPKQSGYINVQKLKQDRDASHVAMVNEFHQAGAHMRRARDLAQVLGYEGAQVDEILNQLDICLNLMSPPPPGVM